MIGASIVKNFMESSVCLKTGAPSDDMETSAAVEKDCF